MMAEFRVGDWVLDRPLPRKVMEAERTWPEHWATHACES